MINYAAFISTKPRLLTLYMYILCEPVLYICMYTRIVYIYILIDCNNNKYKICDDGVRESSRRRRRGGGSFLTQAAQPLILYNEDKCTRHFQYYQRIFVELFFRAQTSLINIRVRTHPTVNSFIKT